jgi:hypothetical protein
MSRTLQFKRYPQSTVAGITGAAGELIIDTTNNILTVHDGVTRGGYSVGVSANTVSVVFNKANTSNIIAQASFDQGNSTIILVQSSFDKANSANVLAQAAFDRANTPGSGQFAFEKANSANVLAQSAFNQANTANVLAQYAFDTANTANASIQTAFNQANTANALAQSAFNQANTANTLASTKLNTTGGTITGNVTITGDLIISGNLTSFSANNIVIDDSIIYVANNNSANVVDIGIVGHYVDSKYQHTGLVRDASDGKWKLFSNVVSEPTTTIDFTNATYETIKVGVIEASNVLINNTDIISYTQTIFNAANTAAQTVPQNAQTTNYTLVNSDAGKHLYYTQSANVNLYIPWSSNASFENGTTIMIVSRTTSSANVTVTPNTGVTMYLAGNTTSASRNVTTYGMATLIQVAANTWFINGTGVA